MKEEINMKPKLILLGALISSMLYGNDDVSITDLKEVTHYLLKDVASLRLEVKSLKKVVFKVSERNKDLEEHKAKNIKKELVFEVSEKLIKYLSVESR